ncbi:MAG: VPLPA-CTERM sorting domain-containing protein [Rhizobiaceae bacterium]|nr:VPLPA-CTERM sorting domain-containing protein [Rhizobiaceae bacterium]
MDRISQNRTLKNCYIASLAAGLLMTTTVAQAGIVATNEHSLIFATAFDDRASAIDLANQGQSTFGGLVEAPFNTFDPAGVNDGVGATNASNVAFWHASNQPNTITFALDTSVNTAGYDISSIQSISGWKDATQSQANQHFELWASTISSIAFTLLGIFDFSPFPDNNQDQTQPGVVLSDVAGYSSVVKLTSDNGPFFAENVDAIQFKYLVASNGGSFPGIVLREIDINGRPALLSEVPVPAALPLFGTGLAIMGFLGWRRKRRTA